MGPLEHCSHYLRLYLHMVGVEINPRLRRIFRQNTTSSLNKA